MKKLFGVIFIIVGIITFLKVFTPSIPETIGGLIGVSLVTFLPAYFLLREKKGEKSQPVREKQLSNGATSTVNQALGISNEKSQTYGPSQRHITSLTDDDYYESLFDELKAKCHPKQFMEPYDHEKVKVANELYARVLNVEDDKEKQNELRQEAVEKLGVKFSSRRLYDKLIGLTNPANFMNPYDAEKVAIANDYYQRVQKNIENVSELENIWKDVKGNTLFASPNPNGHNEEDSDGFNQLVQVLVIVILLAILFVVFHIYLD